MEESVRTCDICGCEIKEENETWVDDQFLCHECVDEHCTTCDHCGETIWINDALQDDDTKLCETCYNDYYHRCECCYRIINQNQHAPLTAAHQPDLQSTAHCLAVEAGALLCHIKLIQPQGNQICAFDSQQGRSCMIGKLFLKLPALLFGHMHPPFG